MFFLFTELNSIRNAIMLKKLPDNFSKEHKLKNQNVRHRFMENRTLIGKIVTKSRNKENN